MNVEKHTAAEAPPDAPEGTAQTEKTALILAPGSVSTNSATLQTCIRAGEGKRRRRNLPGRTRAPMDRKSHFGTEGRPVVPGSFRKHGKQRGYETESAEKRATSEMKFEART